MNKEWIRAASNALHKRHKWNDPEIMEGDCTCFDEEIEIIIAAVEPLIREENNVNP